MKLRHQLAAYSPVTVSSVVEATLGGVGMQRNASARLRERLLARYAANDCMLCGSGTQALQRAIETAAAARGSAGFVALPAFNCYDMASAAIGAGVRVALYDIDPLTLAPNAASFESVLAAGASVAVLAYLYGVPFDWGALARVAERYGVPLIEDAAQGHGSSWQGTPLGALGRVSIISFGRGKGWTGGNGGAVFVRGGAVATSARAKPASGNARTAIGLAAQWILGRPALYGLPRSIPSLALGETVYHAPSPVAAMTTAAAAAAVANETMSDREAGIRAASAARYRGELQGSRASLISPPPGAQGGYIRFPVLVAGGMASLSPRAAELGVAPSYPTSLARLPQLQDRLIAMETSFPGADRLASDLVTLPAHSMISGDEHAEIVSIIKGETR